MSAANNQSLSDRLSRARGLAEAVAACPDVPSIAGIREVGAEIVALLADVHPSNEQVSTMDVLVRTECSACGVAWSEHPIVELPGGGAATACPEGRAVQVEYVRRPPRGAVSAEREHLTAQLEAALDQRNDAHYEAAELRAEVEALRRQLRGVVCQSSRPAGDAPTNSAYRQLEHLLSSPGDMSREEIRREGLRLVRAALDEEDAK